MTTIYSYNNKGELTQLWANLKRQAYNTKSESENLSSSIQKLVAAYGGKYSPGCFIFDDDEKASLFVLKFS